MTTRTRTIASFFTVAMAAMLLGAVVTSQIHRPEPALARPAELSTARLDARAAAAPIGLETFRDIAREKTAGVVNIATKTVVKRSRDLRDFFGGDDLFQRFFGPQAGPDRQTQHSLGSGFVIDKEGHILTNRHVIEGAEQISVTLASGKKYEAKLVGKDARTDVAVLKIEPKEALTVLELGDSDQAEPGEWVMAIGNPFGLDRSVTVGVVSFKGRSNLLQGVEMIQTDASINPGNSGGPLLNTRGEVIAINTMIVTQGAAQSAGVGFAVPINVAKEILPQLEEKGRVVRGWLGVVIQSLTDDLAGTYKLKDAGGAVVNEVTPGSPAEKAGLKPDDVVIAVDGHKVRDNADLSHYISTKAPGTTVKIEILRDGREKTLSAALGTFPEEGEREARAEGRKGRLGMRYQDLTRSLAEQLDLPRGTRGVVVTEVEPGSASEDAGLQRGDTIVSVNGNMVASVEEFEAEIDRARKGGVNARLRVRREGNHVILVLKLS